MLVRLTDTNGREAYINPESVASVADETVPAPISGSVQVIDVDWKKKHRTTIIFKEVNGTVTIQGKTAKDIVAELGLEYREETLELSSALRRSIGAGRYLD